MLSHRQKREKKKKGKLAEKSKISLDMIPSQPCGNCTACCTAVGVHEINKPAGQRCEHQVDGGCGIYSERPKSCKDYWCMYRGGMLGDDVNLRPDNAGIILDFRNDTPDDCISGWELWEGAADSPAAMKIIDKFASKFLIGIRRHKSQKRLVFGPPHRVQSLIIRENP